MAVYTATADENGNFQFDLPEPPIAGQKYKVTAQRDGQIKSVDLQAPSIFLDCEGGGSGGGSSIPMNLDFASLILQGRKILLDGDGATVVTEGNVSTLTNTYYKPDEYLPIFQAAKIDLEYYKSLSNSENLLKMRQGQIFSNGSESWFGDGFFVTKAEVADNLARLSGCTLDKNQVYFLLPNSILFNSELNFDEADNYMYEITVDGVSHIYRTNKNYTVSN